MLWCCLNNEGLKKGQRHSSDPLHLLNLCEIFPQKKSPTKEQSKGHDLTTSKKPPHLFLLVAFVFCFLSLM